MKYLNWFTMRAKWLVPGAVGFCALLLAFDLLAFWGFERRPLVSSLETGTLVWALLIGSACTYGARWAITREAATRRALAATLGVMVLMSALHPWLNGWGRDAEQPFAPTLLAQPQARQHNALVFEGGPLSAADDASNW
jgi:hypothetical protein